MEQMRSEFEAWCRRERHGVILKRGADGEYNSHEAQIMWEAWQASRAIVEIEAPETESYLGTRQVTFERDAMWLDSIRAAGLRVKEK